jgi:transcriptional regulator GlxA family with amidase domain
MDQRVLRVIALMEESLHRGWSAGRLAEHVNLSPSRLQQVFKEETGLPPARYLRLLRMQRAKELLETSYLSVKQVMARVGVADESHFVRDFKKTYGLTPARYREKFLNRDLDGGPPAGDRMTECAWCGRRFEPGGGYQARMSEPNP